MSGWLGESSHRCRLWTHRDITAIYRELANLRERMAKLEGAVEGFMRGQIPRDAA